MSREARVGNKNCILSFVFESVTVTRVFFTEDILVNQCGCFKMIYIERVANRLRTLNTSHHGRRLWGHKYNLTIKKTGGETISSQETKKSFCPS